MRYTRRETLALAAGAVAAVAILPRFALAAADDATQEAIDAFTGGAETKEATDLKLTAPEIAENGNTVPIEVEAPGAESIIVFAPGNPNPDVVTFTFGPLSGAQMASTRIRLAGTQEVIAVAKMSDGSYQRASQEVKVTIGGCGG